MENDNSVMQRLEERALRLERKFRVHIGINLLIAMLAVCAWTWQPRTQGTSIPSSLKVSELIVVDPKGVERVRIGGDVPDAIINGRHAPRGDKAAGVLLYDSTGQERGGYLTFDSSGNVALTLDSRKGQVAMFVAGSDPGSALQLWHGRDLIELRSDGDGSRFSAVQGGQVVVQQPSLDKITASTCDIYRGARSRVSEDQVMQDCRRRFLEVACRTCLTQK